MVVHLMPPLMPPDMLQHTAQRLMLPAGEDFQEGCLLCPHRISKPKMVRSQPV